MVNRSEGDAQRFLKVLDAYNVNKDVTTQRIYLETLEDIFQGMNKILINSKDGSTGIVPYLPLRELTPRAPGSTPGQQGGPPGGAAPPSGGSGVSTGPSGGSGR